MQTEIIANTKKEPSIKRTKSNMSKEEIESSHKKALKSLEGEKRAALKKAKGIKGKKGKAALAATEEDFASKLQALEASYQEQVALLAVGSLEISADAEKPSAFSNDDDKNPAVVDEEGAARERKLAKAKKKRDKQKEKEALIEQQIEEENANAGPGLRKIELEQIQAVLTPLKLKVDEVTADGHCLYRAVAAQTGKHFIEIRKFLEWFAKYRKKECCSLLDFRSMSLSLTFLRFIPLVGCSSFLVIQGHSVQTPC